MLEYFIKIKKLESSTVQGYDPTECDDIYVKW